MKEVTEESLGIISSAERLQDEARSRMGRGGSMLKFGIRFLDVIFGGIQPYDLCLVGAKPSSGKTELITKIAWNVASTGKNVYLFALEAEPFEIERRIRFQCVVKLYYAAGGIRSLNYPSWVDGHYDAILKDFEPLAEEQLKESLKHLKTYYRSAGFTIQDFEVLMSVIQSKADLVIVDHIHYFDLQTENENKELATVIKKIMDMVQIYGVPVVLVAHLRKLSRADRLVVPALEDFHGTSNLGKVVTKAVVLGKGEPVAEDPNFMTTYMRIAKFRLFSAAEHYVGKLFFDTKSNQYADGFSIGRLSADETKFIDVPKEKFPDWLNDRLAKSEQN